MKYTCKLSINNAKTRRILDKNLINYNVVIENGTGWIYLTEEDAKRYLMGEF